MKEEREKQQHINETKKTDRKLGKGKLKEQRNKRRTKRERNKTREKRKRRKEERQAGEKSRSSKSFVIINLQEML